MLIPAILKEKEIMENFQKFFYTDDMMYETGCLDNWIPRIHKDDSDNTGYCKYAIVDKNDKLLGYFEYHINWYNSCASQFGLFSFDRGSPIIGANVYREIKKLINEYRLHRIEFRMIGGNPVEKHYDRLCKKYNGVKHILKDVIKDRYGKYHDDIIYEIILGGNQNE